MRKPFCCESSRHLYETYYLNQDGNGLPVFTGIRGQRGHGLGSILGGLFRSALPMLKRGLASFGKHALKTGLDIANDVVAGGDFKDSAKRHIPQGIKRFATGLNVIPQSGGGRGRKRRKSLGNCSRKSKRRRKTRKRRNKSLKKTKTRRGKKNNRKKRKQLRDIFS